MSSDMSLFSPKPGLSPQTLRERVYDKLSGGIGNDALSWIKENEPLCVEMLVDSGMLVEKHKKEKDFLLKLLPPPDRFKDYSFVVAWQLDDDKKEVE